MHPILRYTFFLLLSFLVISCAADQKEKNVIHTKEPVKKVENPPSKLKKAVKAKPAQQKTAKVNKARGAEAYMIQRINHYRQKGCKCGSTMYPPVPPLRWNKTLEKAAKAHVKDMVRNQLFSHTGSDGSSPAERVDRVGYRWSATAENIAHGQRSVDEAIDAWIKSEGHCKNIMRANYREMAIAHEDTYWTQVFATKQ